MVESDCKLEPRMRHTRIVATVGPSCDTPDTLDALIRAGVDVFRLNFSHGTHESHRATFTRIREAASRADRIVAILQDLSGPKIRTGRLAGGVPIPLKAGESLRIVTGDDVGQPGVVYTTYAPLARSVSAGRELLLDDGRVVLRVDATDGTEIRTTVVHGSQLGEHKGINAPGVALPASGLTLKDAEDLAFGLSLGVDMVALSFVQSAADVQAARNVTEEHAPGTPIVAKLERPEALEHLDAVLASADAVMVARGDLGLEVPLEQVPRMQKEITRRARALGRPVIVATQVLESMRHEPRPTRAEVSDAANAVDDGVDAIMLAGETAAGDYPVKAVETLDAIIRDAEMLPPLAVASVARLMHAEHGRALCEAAVTLADRGEADAIVAVTREGNTARMLAALRPNALIFAATNRVEVARRLMLYRGVVPIVTTIAENVDATGTLIARHLLASGLVKPGEEVVFVSIHSDPAQPAANFLKLHQL
jgi:pyruvate kinase